MAQVVGAELEVIDAWLHGVLSADVTLAGLLARRVDGLPNVYADVGDEDAPHPLVVWSLSTALDVNTGPSPDRILVNALYTVKAVTDSPSWADLRPIVGRVDELLQAASGAPAGGGYVAGCRREQPVRYIDTASGGVMGRQYRHRGGIYRIWAHL